MMALSAGTDLRPAAASDQMFEPTRIEILEVAPYKCPVPRGVCVTAGAATTLPAPSVRPGELNVFTGNDAIPRFTRTVNVAGYRNNVRVDDSTPWTIEVNAELLKSAMTGNALFLVYDDEDPKALAKHEVTAAWQANIPAGDRLAARLTLSPNDGFRANHTYLIRVVQLLNGKETLLAKGKVRLA
jgi:hypothetical protein